MYACVFFDFDDTLYDQGAPFARAYRELLGDLFVVDARDLFVASRRHSDELFEASEAGTISMDEMYTQRIKLAFRDLGMEVPDADCLTMQRLYARYQETAISLTPTMCQVLDLTAARSLPAIISNGPHEHQRAKMETIGVYRWVAPERVFISSEVGVAKPEPGIYELALERLGLASADCLYVGDAFYPDVVGAKASGMDALWFNHRLRRAEGDLRPDFEVRSEAELLECLRGLL